jgi:hypothetical protein
LVAFSRQILSCQNSSCFNSPLNMTILVDYQLDAMIELVFPSRPPSRTLLRVSTSDNDKSMLWYRDGSDKSVYAPAASRNLQQYAFMRVKYACLWSETTSSFVVCNEMASAPSPPELCRDHNSPFPAQRPGHGVILRIMLCLRTWTRRLLSSGFNWRVSRRSMPRKVFG